MVTEAFPWDTAPRYLLRDRDTSYGWEFCNRVEAMGITEVMLLASGDVDAGLRRVRVAAATPLRRFKRCLIHGGA
jgi:hypothetical protein